MIDEGKKKKQQKIKQYLTKAKVRLLEGVIFSFSFFGETDWCGINMSCTTHSTIGEPIRVHEGTPHSRLDWVAPLYTKHFFSSFYLFFDYSRNLLGNNDDGAGAGPFANRRLFRLSSLSGLWEKFMRRSASRNISMMAL